MRIDTLESRLREHGHRPALRVAGRTYSYRALLTIAAHIGEVTNRLPAGAPVGILTGRSLAAYAGVLAAMLSGRAYVPLNADYPAERLCRIAASAALGAIVCDPRTQRLAETLCDASPASCLTIRCDGNGTVALPGGSASSGTHAQDHSEARAAYIMFTSGTTGDPKGIVISRANLSAYLDGIGDLFDFRPSDRFSQFFNLSFDLSVHDMFVAWMTGGCLYVPDAAELMDPVGFARRHDLSVWFSVPSAASLAMRFRKLRPDSLPGLRHALFCGEALSGETAKAFARAAPNAALTNLYGPTEATIAITSHRISKDDGGANSVPIGRAFPGQETLVLRDDQSEAAIGEVGELWLGGAQVAAGYTNNPEQTAEKFRRFNHPGCNSQNWYATGDLVERHPEDGLIYRGRKDDQIKLNGHRIELTEVEETLRAAAGTPLGIVAPTPADNPTRLIALVCKPERPEAEILERMKRSLPGFMIPASIRAVDDMSFNQNGKLDRKQTLGRLAAA